MGGNGKLMGEGRWLLLAAHQGAINGRWIYGFTKNLGTASAYMAELWGLHEGLLLARSCCVQQLEIQLDSNVVVCSLKEGKIGSALSCVSSTTTMVYT
ncbi:Polynucleotidyl transferase, ribonuclease H superfamily protein [Trifolium repens]|nr:Polynucleotidyl transferase, ribonuclease H superfamily protein [Trifolium repens]